MAFKPVKGTLYKGTWILYTIPLLDESVCVYTWFGPWHAVFTCMRKKNYVQGVASRKVLWMSQPHDQSIYSTRASSSK